MAVFIFSSHAILLWYWAGFCCYLLFIFAFAEQLNIDRSTVSDAIRSYILIGESSDGIVEKGQNEKNVENPQMRKIHKELKLPSLYYTRWNLPQKFKTSICASPSEYNKVTAKLTFYTFQPSCRNSHFLQFYQFLCGRIQLP